MAIKSCCQPFFDRLDFPRETSDWKQKVLNRNYHKASTYQTQTSSQTDTKNSRNKAIKLAPEKAALSAVFNALLLPVFTGWKEQSQSKTSKRVIERGWEWTWKSLYEDSSFTSRGTHG